MKFVSCRRSSAILFTFASMAIPLSFSVHQVSTGMYTKSIAMIQEMPDATYVVKQISWKVAFNVVSWLAERGTTLSPRSIARLPNGLHRTTPSSQQLQHVHSLPQWKPIHPTVPALAPLRPRPAAMHYQDPSPVHSRSQKKLSNQC